MGFFLNEKQKIEVLQEKLKTVLPMRILKKKSQPPKPEGFFLNEKQKIEVLHEKMKTVLPMGSLKKNPDHQLQQTFKPVRKNLCTFLTA